MVANHGGVSVGAIRAANSAWIGALFGFNTIANSGRAACSECVPHPQRIGNLTQFGVALKWDTTQIRKLFPARRSDSRNDGLWNIRVAEPWFTAGETVAAEQQMAPALSRA
jgi:hypothetical protein